MIKEKIEIGKIKGEVKQRIGECDTKIRDFMLLLDNLLEYEKKDKVCNSSFFVIREITDIPGKFGAKAEKGYKYSAYWCYQLNPNKSLEDEKIYSGAIKQEECLFFKYKDVEKIKDNSSNGEESEFSLSLCGLKLPHEYNEHEVIDCNNKKLAITSIIKEKNLLICAEKIEALIARRKKFEFIKSQEIKL